MHPTLVGGLEQVIGADLSTLDKDFSHLQMESEVSSALQRMDLNGEPSCQSLTNMVVQLIGKARIATPWGELYAPNRHLVQSGAFGVQYIQSMRTAKIGV